MATSDSQARIRITAKDETKSAFASASKSLAALDNVAGGIRGRFLALGPVIASAFSVQAFQGVVNLLDQLNDISDATGASIEALSHLDGVARRNGGTMDDVAAILVKFNGALKDAKPDSPVAKALEAIGLSAEELRRDDPAEALEKVAKSLAGFADDGNKARLVQELFGKSIKEAAPLLKDLAEASRRYGQATREQTDAAELFNKQMASLKAEAEDAGRALTVKFLPYLNDMAGALRRSAEEGSLLVDTLSLLTSSPLKAIVKGFADSIPTQSEAERLQSVITGLENIQKREPDNAANNRRLAVLRKQLEAYQDLGVELKRLQAIQSGRAATADPRPSVGVPGGPPARGAGGRSAGAAAGTGEFVGPPILEGTAEALRAIEQVDSQRIKGLQETLAALVSIRAGTGGGAVDEAILDIEEALQRLDPAAQEAAKSQAAIDALLANTPSAQVARYAEQLDLLASALEDTADPKRAQQLREALAMVQENIDKIGKGSEQTLDKLSVFADEASRNIQDALGDTLESALQGNFDNIGQMWLQLIQRMTAQALAARLNEALFGSAGGGNGGLFGTIGGALFGGATSGGATGAGAAMSGATDAGASMFTPAGGVTPVASGGAGTTVINVAAGPTRNEVLTAIQMAQRASDAKFEARLRRAGIS